MKAFIVLVALVGCAVANPGLVYSNILGQPLTSVQYSHTPALTYAAAPALTYAAAPALTYSAAPALTYASAPAITYSSVVVAPVATKTQYHAQDVLGQASFGYAHPGQAHAAVRDASGNVKGSYAYVDPNGKQVRVDYVADNNGFRAESDAIPKGPVANLVAPEAVKETPEVAAARAAHLQAVNEVKNRQRRQAIFAASPLAYANYPYQHALTYNASPLTYSSPITYSSGLTSPITYAAPLAQTYTSTLISHPVKETTLTKVINNPGHAVSYRIA